MMHKNKNFLQIYILFQKMPKILIIFQIIKKKFFKIRPKILINFKKS